MSNTLIRELPTMEAKLDATRIRLQHLGIDRLAVLDAENPPCQELAARLAVGEMIVCPDLDTVLAASEDRQVASIVPLTEAGELVRNGEQSMTACISRYGKLAIAAIELEPAERQTVLAVVSARRY